MNDDIKAEVERQLATLRQEAVQGIAVAWVFGLGLASLGGILVWSGGIEQRELAEDRALAQVEWARVPATIVTSVSEDRRIGKRGSITVYCPRFSFTYEVDGQAYWSELYSPVDLMCASNPAGARYHLEQWPVGHEFQAYIHPGQPALAYMSVTESPVTVAYRREGVQVRQVSGWTAAGLGLFIVAFGHFRVRREALEAKAEDAARLAVSRRERQAELAARRKS